MKGDNAVVAKVYDPIMCMMVDKPDKAKDAISKAIETTDAEGEKWITMRGSHVKIDGEGNAVAGNERVKNIINSGKAGASKESSASENNKQNANKSKADAEKTKKVDSVMKKYGERHSYSPTLRDMLSLSVDIGKKYDEDGIIDDDDIKQYKQKYDKLLDMHMDYDISKTTMNKINTDLVKVLKDYGFDKYQLKSLGWAYTGRDSMPALDEAIKTADGATGDKLYADVKAIYNLFSNILLTYTNEQSVQKLANEGTKKCLELAAKVKGVRDEAIKVCDAVETKDAVDPIQRRKREIVVKTENYLRSIGKSNSVGKFDRVVQGVKNLLYQGFLEGTELDRAIKQEADRLIKKYNL